MTGDPGLSLLPLADSAWPDSVADLREGFAGSLNVYRRMAHHPALLRAWADLREHVVHATALGPDLSEIAILRIGARLGSTYEWAHHVVRARARGVSEARIASARGAPADMAKDDALICGAVDELLDARALSPETAVRIAARVGGPPAVLDLIATTGFYSVLAYLLNLFDTPIDDDILAALEIAPPPA